MTAVHPNAVIEDGARIGKDCTIGPFCVVGPDVVLGDRVVLKSNVVVSGCTEIGDDTVIFPFAVIGEIPQDLKFKGEQTRLVIGKRNRIREHVTMNVGTEAGGGITRVGDDCMFMVGCHIAHDVQVGNRCIVVNNVPLAGHVVLEDDVIVGGNSAVHQWVRIGRGAIIGGLARVTRDVIPYGQIQPPGSALDGLNLIGLKRSGVSREDITALRKAFKELSKGDGNFLERARRLPEISDSPYVREIVDFIMSDSDRSFMTPSGD
jgi:UDP-N-acetylglucosamine acyltransferase